jgi:RNA polymerase sigma factor (sigma-70 family)
LVDAEVSDAALIVLVRSGEISAYADLYPRHVASAYNLAHQLTRSPAEADDLVAEAFRKVMEQLTAGRGPDSAFRPYLLTTVRHTAYDTTRRDRRIELHDDLDEVNGAKPESVSVPFIDAAVAGPERSLAARASDGGSPAM